MFRQSLNGCGYFTGEMYLWAFLSALAVFEFLLSKCDAYIYSNSKFLRVKLSS